MGLISPGTNEILVLAVIASLVIAGFTKGAIGVGMPIIAMPLLDYVDRTSGCRHYAYASTDFEQYPTVA